MDKLTILFIRACKSKHPTKRLSQLYRRFYGFYDQVTEDNTIVSVLRGIVDKYFPIKLEKYLREEDSYYSFCSFNREQPKRNEIRKLVLRDHIAHQARYKLIPQGFIPARRWRK